jgi:diaminopimelate decarboxylase
MHSALGTADSGNVEDRRQALIRRIALAVGTPTYVYDAAALRERLALVRQHFELVRFAQKALSNIHVLRLLRQGHALVDCVSEGELERALAAGFRAGVEPAEIEPGRYLVAGAGILVAEVRATKTMGTNHFVLVDAGFNDLVRPAMYGAEHRISLMPRTADDIATRATARACRATTTPARLPPRSSSTATTSA